MTTNDPGREPTDAELERRFEQWWNEEGVGTMPRYGQDQDEFNRSLTHAAWMNGAFVASGARPMPDTKLCGAVTQAGEDRKFRTCELPSGHEGRHESHLGGETVWWENTGPECEHGHLARKCVTCELIAAETLIARQSDLLTGVANALKGQAGETELWSHSDLPEMAERLTARIADLERKNAALGAEVNNARRLAGEGGA